MTHRLYNKDNGAVLGTISQRRLKTLVDLLEEEGEGDRDYYVDRDALDYLAEQGVDSGLLELIRSHVTGEGGIEIEWEEE